MSRVGGRVRKLRVERHLTQRELGDLAGLFHTTISELERGVTEPTIDTLNRIATALNVAVTLLLSDDTDA